MSRSIVHLTWINYVCDREISKMRCQLSTLMGKERYSIQDVHIKTGLARSTVTQLYHDKAKRIDYETIEKLCELFGCSISELFVLDGNTTEMDGRNSNGV